MFEPQNDQISIKSSDTSLSGKSLPDIKVENKEDENEQDDFQNDQNYGMEINNTGSTRNNVTMNNSKNATIGDLHNFYGPVTLIMHAKTENMVTDKLQQSINSKMTFKNEIDIVEEAELKKNITGMCK